MKTYRFTSRRYREHLRSAAWQRLRLRVIRNAGGRCQLCNDAGPLEVHHRDYARMMTPEEELDLVALCETCHETHTALRRLRNNRWARRAVRALCRFVLEVTR